MRTRQFPLGAATPSSPWSDGWQPAPGTATLLTLAVVAVRVVASVATGVLVATLLGRPQHWWGWVLSWILLASVVSMVLSLTHRLTIRVAPLALLLRLSMAFPGTAPSRFAVALRAGSTRRLGEHLDRDEALVMGNNPVMCAEHLLSLVAVLNVHDRATRGHSERVRSYTELIAEELDLDEEQRQRLRWAGLLHDVGKIRTPSTILNKRGTLDDGEWEVIRRHPLDGLALAEPLRPWLGDALGAVSDHHERFEGGGYPSGWGGADISLAGRIVAVADAYDVITSPRSYKAPIGVREARAELVRCADTQFDPDVVRAFLAISIPRLRAVLGILGTGTLLSVLQWRLARLSEPLVRLTGAAALAGGLLLITVPEQGGVNEEPVAAPAAVPPQTSGASMIDRRLPPTPAAPGPAAGSVPASAIRPAPSPTAAVPSASSPEVPDGGPGASGPAPELPEPNDDQGPDEPPNDGDDPEASGRVGVRIDPAAGSVGLTGLPIDTGDELRLVEAPAAGSLVCAGVSLCEPIQVDLPLQLVDEAWAGGSRP